MLLQMYFAFSYLFLSFLYILNNSEEDFLAIKLYFACFCRAFLVFGWLYIAHIPPLDCLVVLFNYYLSI